ncbi:TAT-variant-translocated molybdopterin oxidoreductase [Winogradskyella luteola]|uniref:TAT-variant-translocated molybdopterin oxidoreductase n=1 Tax=Winogradskyella luteola TaxID=2828330 RepID=A0A9X1JNT7_9FLAO|nr:TAT-variant-translocated molybdopterin oxidoreductase [Winogradskyella luteola]MBV7269741.1 TAT-variant-translocated molybdopterin oxidoreductase [Winogradskyella luteola]
MSSNKKYWKSVEELNENSSIVETLQQNEFVEAIPTDEFLGDKESLESSSTSRRDFLKYVGFSTAAASLAACEGPVIKSIPYVVQPTEIIPGVANYYATTIANGFDFASVLVKTREGRPIKIENNTDAATNGIANARVNASVLGLYDNLRVKTPMKGDAKISWDTFMSETTSKLNGLADGKQIVFLTATMPSPSTNKLISEFASKYGNVKHVAYDAVSESATLDAYEAKYGKRGMANYDFSKAKTIVSVGADFLGDWQGGGFESAYAKKRVPDHGKMSRHIQFESNMSLSGANADKRVPMTPSQQRLALAKLYSYVTGNSVGGGNLPEGLDAAIKAAAKELSTAGSNAVVVTGIQDVNAQTTVLEINAHLRSKAFDPKTTIYTRQGSDKAVMQLVADMKAGKVGAIIMNGVNPMYTLQNASDFAEGLAKTELSVAFSMKQDETASNCQYIAATPHNLESWGDYELKSGHYSMMQPTIRPLFDTKQFQEVLLAWNGNSTSYRDYIKSYWTSNILGGASFNKAIQDGVFVVGGSGNGSGNGSSTVTTTTELKDKKDRTFVGGIIHDVAVGVGIKEEDKDEYVTTTTSTTVNNGGSAGLGSVLSGGDAARALASSAKSQGGMELSLYTKIGMGDGQQANNPWLQEFPDPITRTTWDNYLTVSQADADKLELKNWNVANGGLNGSYANVTVNGVTVENVPVIIQPGQAKGSVGLAFGYGRTSDALKKEMKTGVNAYPLYQDFNTVQNVTIEKVTGEHEFACVQLHNTLMGRGDIIKETTLEIFNTKDKHVWNEVPVVSLNHIETPVTSPDVDLWDEFDRSVGHHFNLSIDLNACTGCGACVIACHAENNVPVVGKTEMRRSRDMHWLRIDRYYSSQDSFEGDNEKKDNISGLNSSLSEFGEMESPADNPQVAFQPVMCQHCNHAPCETVCPVAATAHGRQGQNHMAYNRCVGTRYCANNCPYKVRRFNWFLYNKNDEFDYYMNDDLGRMVLNPDVTVRSRGVMEKCSMCIQKTQKTILDAKREGRPVKDGEFQTACSAACGNGAMVFGDINDKDSKIAELKDDNRAYHLLEHVGVKPNVVYQTKVRNTAKA